MVGADGIGDTPIDVAFDVANNLSLLGAADLDLDVQGDFLVDRFLDNTMDFTLDLFDQIALDVAIDIAAVVAVCVVLDAGMVVLFGVFM